MITDRFQRFSWKVPGASCPRHGSGGASNSAVSSGRVGVLRIQSQHRDRSDAGNSARAGVSCRGAESEGAGMKSTCALSGASIISTGGNRVDSGMAVAPIQLRQLNAEFPFRRRDSASH
jgi:hypothetical protein